MKMKMNPAGRERNGRREETDHLTCVIKTKDGLNVRHGQPNFISGQVARSNGAVIKITALEHLPEIWPLLLLPLLWRSSHPQCDRPEAAWHR